jgi:Ni2+-binding GTPase involved in maturation of urease and hydrogenase
MVWGPIESPRPEPERKESDMKVYHGNKSTIPSGAVSIGRGSSFVNPFVVGRDAETQADVIRKFTKWTKTQPRFVEIVIDELRGRGLVCDCDHQDMCHGVVLLKLANGDRIHKKRGQQQIFE